MEFICANNLEYIKTLETNSIDLIYFDPPFGITEAESIRLEEFMD